MAEAADRLRRAEENREREARAARSRPRRCDPLPDLGPLQAGPLIETLQNVGFLPTSPGARSRMRSEPRNGEVWIDSRSQETTIDETRRRIKMGRIVATEYISLDGVIEAPGGGEPAIEG
jgi:hypothetical protein